MTFYQLVGKYLVVDTRTAILDAAQTLVQTRGANGMSYEHISSVVGIRKASIHYHFPTKAALLSAVLQRYTERFLGAVDEIIASDLGGLGRLKAFVALFEATLRQAEGRAICACGMLASDLGTLDAATAERVRSFYRESIKRLTVILDSGVADRSLPIAGDSERIASLVFSLLQGALTTARVEGGTRWFRTMAQDLYALCGAA